MSNKKLYRYIKPNSEAKCINIYNELVEGKYRKHLEKAINTISDHQYKTELMNIFEVLNGYRNTILINSSNKCNATKKDNKELSESLCLDDNSIISYDYDKRIWQFDDSKPKKNGIEKVLFKITFSDKNEVESLEYSNDRDYKRKISSIELRRVCGCYYLLNIYDNSGFPLIRLSSLFDPSKEVYGFKGARMESIIRRLQKRRRNMEFDI